MVLTGGLGADAAIECSGKAAGLTATLPIESTAEGFERLIDPAGGDAKILIGAGAAKHAG